MRVWVKAFKAIDPLPMRTFPAGDRVRGLNISDCSSPESYTCSKGEFSKRTEDDRAGRTRMFAGVPFFGATFLRANKKGGGKVF